MALTWSHTESDPPTTAKAAIQAAQSGAWESLDAPTCTRYLRMLTVLSLQAGLMTNVAPRPRGPEAPVEYGRYEPGQFRDRQSLEIASVVLRTPQLILPTGTYSVMSATTNEGEPVILQGDGQALDVAAPVVLWVLGIAACAIASIAIAQIGGDVIDRQLTRSEDTKRLLGSQANAVQVLMDHGKREQDARQAIPYTDAELAVISNLAKVQSTIAEKRQTPLPSPFAGAADKFGDAANAIKGGLADLAPWAVAAGVAYWLFMSNGTRSEE